VIREEYLFSILLVHELLEISRTQVYVLVVIMMRFKYLLGFLNMLSRSFMFTLKLKVYLTDPDLHEEEVDEKYDGQLLFI
jgi:hypothetical protein